MTTTPVFVPPKAPFIGPTLTGLYKTKQAQFGDDYVQQGADGINNVQHSITLQWTALAPNDALTIKGFFDNLAGWQAFLYQIPGDTKQRQWKAKNPQFAPFSRYSTFQIDLTEDFSV